jgi:hypothetical protein
VSDGDAVVDRGFTLTRRVPAVNSERPEFRLQHGRHAVLRLQLAALQILPMGVQIDEAWGDHQTKRVDDLPAAQRFP